ncbi:MAG: TatD family hydrolase [Acidobacteria bacterium]|jgi:TatD DNase family protein|nr:TatD family hydrolase [Acidobacteriota bacterium]
MIFVDSHCHIDGEAFDADRDEIVRRANDAGVKAMLTIGTGNPHDGEIERAVRVAEKYENVFAAIGVHPHDAKLYDDKAENHLIDLVKKSDKVIAWGEIGLDFYYDNSPRDVQKEVFRRQIRTARELNLPIIIHSRDADSETVQILREECAPKTENDADGNSENSFPGGIMHCFGGTAEMAKDLMEIGFMISFAGNITFKKADNLRDAARVVTLDKLLIETDCPFLTPIPFRGKRNEPAYVVHTAKFLADFYEIEVEELARQTTENFKKFFNLTF